MANNKLNVCVHDIVPDDSSIKSVYDITLAQLNMLLEVLKNLRKIKFLSSYDIFFDDGYESFRMIVEQSKFGVENNHIHSAIITEQVGTEGRLNNADLIWLGSRGYSIDSHGVSHAALAIFKKEVLLETDMGRQYENMPYLLLRRLRSCMS